MCSVATDRITKRDFYEMLTIPSHEMWTQMERANLVTVAPGCGLYLHSIAYKPEDEWDLNAVIENPRGMAIRSFLENRQYRAPWQPDTAEISSKTL